MNIRLLVLLLTIVVMAPAAVEAAQSCEELARYRDTELFHQWEVAIERKRLFEDAKREAKDFGQRTIQESKLARSDLALDYAVVMQDIKTSANLIGNVLDIFANTGTAKTVAVKAGEKVFGRLSPQTAEALLKGNDTVQRVTDGGLAYAFAVEWGAEAVPIIGPALKALWDLANDSADRDKLIKDHAQLRQDVYERVSNLVRTIDDAKAQIRRSELALKQIAAIKEGIDLLCSRQAKVTPDDARKPTVDPRTALVGTWDYTVRCFGRSESHTLRISSVGSDGSLSVTASNRHLGGSMKSGRMEGNSIQMTWSSFFNTVKYIGHLKSPSQIEGTYTQTLSGETCPWSATKQ